MSFARPSCMDPSEVRQAIGEFHPDTQVITTVGVLAGLQQKAESSLRDEFAANAMPIAATFFDTSEDVCDQAATWCYRMADAMLKARRS